jgi:biotin carboxyl carrier protein
MNLLGLILVVVVVMMMVLEAMKMETNITAPISGKVKSVRAKAGDSVKVNQIVADFD